MPIYEYECNTCGQIEEAIQKFSDRPLTKCKQCSGKLHKLISNSSFHLKGTGWYATDYAGKSGNAGSNTRKAEESTSGAEEKGTPPDTKKATKKKD